MAKNVTTAPSHFENDLGVTN